MKATFKTGETYTATNYRTHESVTVKCIRNTVEGTWFELANGKTFKAYRYDNATNYDLNARNNKLHLIVKTFA